MARVEDLYRREMFCIDNVILKIVLTSSGPYNHEHYILVESLVIFLEAHIFDRVVPEMCQKVNIWLLSLPKRSLIKEMH